MAIAREGSLDFSTTVSKQISITTGAYEHAIAAYEMVATGLELIAIGSLVVGTISAINSTISQKKARSERPARTRPNGYEYDGLEEDDTDLGPGGVDWKVESRERARGMGGYREQSRRSADRARERSDHHEESRRRNRSTRISRSRSVSRPVYRSIHTYNKSRDSFGPLNRVDTDGWYRESYEDEIGRFSTLRSYVNSRTYLGTQQLKSQYREHSRSQSRPRRRHKSQDRGSDSQKLLVPSIALAVVGAALIGAQYASKRRDQYAEHRIGELGRLQDGDRRRGTDP